MDTLLHESLAYVDGPAVLLAWEGVAERRWPELRALDDEVYAQRPSSTVRAASRAVGTRLLRTWGRLRPHPSIDAMLSTDGADRRRRGSWTLTVAFGAVCASAGIAQRDALEGFMYTRLAAAASAAMRLMPLGQLEAHAIVAESLAVVPMVVSRRDGAPRSAVVVHAALRPRGDGSTVRAVAVVPVMTHTGAVRLGIGGPVGSGKTALVDALCKRMRDDYRLGVVTNDIFTREDMEFLVRSGALPADRIIGVQTGGCPHTAIREDASMNFDALDDLARRHPDLDLVFLESGGDNLAASFSPELVDAAIYVIDVSGGDKIPRKGGPGVTRSDLLVINKIDLAPHVGASLEVMARDARAVRGERPFIFSNLKTSEGLEAIVSWIQRELFFDR